VTQRTAYRLMVIWGIACWSTLAVVVFAGVSKVGGGILAGLALISSLAWYDDPPEWWPGRREP
jgi:hypothetical protein